MVCRGSREPFSEVTAMTQSELKVAWTSRKAMEMVKSGHIRDIVKRWSGQDLLPGELVADHKLLFCPLLHCLI